MKKICDMQKKQNTSLNEFNLFKLNYSIHIYFVRLLFKNAVDKPAGN